ncbi:MULTISPECIES: DUF3082 domain-containing protein [unclassified Leptolyngbya]|uniref:DUF3082 domain-containing protein n=1 Tax=unclassified Leptolyngbya TaxID=2650499 RepID=UPI00168767D2|nr:MULTISPECIES: DUF3082 domain-containing protein [unclassified Leptolyngbya]MBD1912415.1 DUF3082 domain-containing protein [Leptolyngbya sp. FACHB-8]MBD2157916.1 DUF3082 domain-containing protein [Leptolyngbya sp. FACHB-16]
MVNEPSQNLQTAKPKTQEEPLDKPPTVLRCVTGAVISALFSVGLYMLTTSIHQTLDATPIVSDNYLTVRISTLVRSLVIGMGALGTITFSVTTLGLIGLALQLLIKGQPATSDK